MLINLTDVLTSEGSSFSREVPLEMTEFESGTGSYPLVGKPTVVFTFTNAGKDKAWISGEAKLTFQAGCDRCLTEVQVPLDIRFRRLTASADVRSEDDEVDDLSFMKGSQLDTEAFMHNEIMGNWPAKILCRDDCRGICPKCGQNLNIRDCGCDTFVPDPRMAVIQDIFNANKEV